MALVAAAMLAGAARAAADVPCSGAAARDTERHCTNHRLRFRVVPTPADALLEVSRPCVTTEVGHLWWVCASGAEADEATATVALIGDSHAGHFGPAMREVADQTGLRVMTIWRPGCPFSTATPLLEPQRSADCGAWVAHVIRWLDEHPEIHTVFLSAHARARVIPTPGVSSYETKVDGYLSAIASLPTSVTSIVVLRDIPGNPVKTRDCVVRAMRRRLAAGAVCQVTKSSVLRPDPLADAAERTELGNVHVVDLTPFMCGLKFCRPVVGGVLVHKDGDHLTGAFSTSLGPYILRAVRRMKPTIEGFR